MKNLIVFLLLLLNIGAVGAQQYSIVRTGTASPYTCRIVNGDPMNYPWTNSDLVTWIFPDGQYQKSVIEADATGHILNGSDIIIWNTAKAPLTSTNEIVAYVAKKGGPTNPKRSTPNPFSGVFTNNSPPAFSFLTGNNWQVDKTWEFSPMNETFLLVSYIPTCPLASGTDYIQLQYNQNQLDYMGEYIAFNSEVVTATPGMITITDFSYNGAHKHILLKMKLNSTELGLPIQLSAIGKFCSLNTVNVTLPYVVKGGPHDPNKKTVDIKNICSNQPDSITLTYTVQFQNDGKVPVDKVDVTDNLSQELQPSSFDLKNTPVLNGIVTATEMSMSTDIEKRITFTSASPGSGLPGLGQTDPVYSYDQTIYRYTFQVATVPYLNHAIDNFAEVVFYDIFNNPLPAILTDIAHVAVDTTMGPDCYVSTSEVPNLLSNLVLQPNPFQDQINISFELKEKSKLNVEVYDIWGRRIESIGSGEYVAGVQNFAWNGKIFPDGVYLLVLHTEKGAIIQKMVKVR